MATYGGIGLGAGVAEDREEQEKIDLEQQKINNAAIADMNQRLAAGHARGERHQFERGGSEYRSADGSSTVVPSDMNYRALGGDGGAKNIERYKDQMSSVDSSYRPQREFELRERQAQQPKDPNAWEHGFRERQQQHQFEMDNKKLSWEERAQKQQYDINQSQLEAFNDKRRQDREQIERQNNLTKSVTGMIIHGLCEYSQDVTQQGNKALSPSQVEFVRQKDPARFGNLAGAYIDNDPQTGEPRFVVENYTDETHKQTQKVVLSKNDAFNYLQSSYGTDRAATMMPETARQIMAAKLGRYPQEDPASVRRDTFEHEKEMQTLRGQNKLDEIDRQGQVSMGVADLKARAKTAEQAGNVNASWLKAADIYSRQAERNDKAIEKFEQANISNLDQKGLDEWANNPENAGLVNQYKALLKRRDDIQSRLNNAQNRAEGRTSDDGKKEWFNKFVQSERARIAKLPPARQAEATRRASSALKSAMNWADSKGNVDFSAIENQYHSNLGE